MSLSVIIPAYNAARWLPGCIESCQSQGYRELQVIIVDDKSSDDTIEVAAGLAQRDPRIQVVRQSSNRGCGGARNTGLEHATAEHIMFLDADDFIAPGALAPAMQRVAGEALDALVGCSTNFEQTPSPELESTEPRPFPDDPLASLIARPPVVSAVILRRTTERFNEAMRTSDAHDYFFRVFPRIKRIAFTPSVLTQIRQGRDPERLTNHIEHFEPMHRLHLLVELKQRLWRCAKMTPEREDALDFHIASYAYRARGRGHRALGHLLEVLDGDRLASHSWYQPAGLSGFMHRLGPRAGLEAFYRANAALGRAPV